MRPTALCKIRLLLTFLTLLLICISSPLGADQPVCHSQPDMTEKELRQGIKAMQDIIDQKGTLTPEEEENMIRSRDLDSDRLNCLMGKLMAANDIFGWGRVEDYGVPLTGQEKKISVKYKKDSLMLKRYMEEVLNVRLE